MNIPSTVSPPGGTMRGIPNGMSGKILSASGMTAVRYGKVAVRLVISSLLLYLDLTSSFSRS
jgi:hypothetical protein